MTDSSQVNAAEHILVVPRTTRYFTLGDIHEDVRELWIVCHGHGQLAGRFIRHFQPLDDGSRVIAAPEALSRYYLDSIPERRGQTSPRIGATWMTKEFREHEISDYVRYLDILADELVAQLSPKRIVVLGFSQGVATVCRWMATAKIDVSDLILWGGQIPPETDLARWGRLFEKTRLTMVLGDKDEFITPKLVAAEEARLASAQIPYRMERYDGDHSINGRALSELATRLTSVR